MTPQQLDELDRKWRSLRHKKLSEIIEMKLSVDQYPTDKLLAEMELDRRKFVRDVMIDRFVSIASFIIALFALLFPLCKESQHKPQAQAPAIQSAHAPGLATNSASIHPLPATKK